jgi:uncharacterized protein
MTTDEFVPDAVAEPIGPVTESARIDVIDAVRGLALLGIFMVNINSFGQAIGEFARTAPPPGSPFTEVAAFYFVKIFFESKSYPLFAMLFGAGLVLQSGRAQQAGRSFFGPGLRRLTVLLLMGAAHALLFWYGDILFLYAAVGILLFFVRRARPTTLAVLGAGFLLISLFTTALLIFFVKHSGESPPPAAAAPEIRHFEDPYDTFWRAFKNDELKEPEAPLWIQTETQAYREGPYRQLFLFRMTTWLIILIFAALGYGWHIAAMVFFGAALYKAGLFEAHNRHWWWRLLRIGLCVGLPCAIVAPFCKRFIGGAVGEIVAEFLVFLGGPLLSLGYMGAIALLVNSGKAPVLIRGLTSAGRMALTNYLSQTLIATTIFYYYGLGLFGRTTDLERIGIVLAVYLVQIILSTIWLRYFQFGPMEWLWRTLTYLRPQPMLRA